MKLVILGSISLDSVTTPFGAVTDVLGGSASFSALAASYFSSPGVVSIVGADFPVEHRELLTQRSIDLTGVQLGSTTFRWGGRYEFDMNEAITEKTELNALPELKADLPTGYAGAPILLLANSDPVLQRELAVAMPQAFTLLDTMNYWIDAQRDELIEAIRMADVLILNDAEARQLCQEFNLMKVAQQLLALGPQFVIIKQGEHGALMVSASSRFQAPGYPLEVIKDPTGAGDSFAGALAGYLATQPDRGEATLRRAVIYGSTLASFCVEDFSVNGITNLTHDRIEERYHAFKQLGSF